MQRSKTFFYRGILIITVVLAAFASQGTLHAQCTPDPSDPYSCVTPVPPAPPAPQAPQAPQASAPSAPGTTCDIALPRPEPVLFTDGRINATTEDVGQTAAVYCNPDCGVSVVAVQGNVGKIAFTVKGANLDKVPANPSQDTLIKQALGVALYRASTGGLKVTGPGGYKFEWDSCHEFYGPKS